MMLGEFWKTRHGIETSVKITVKKSNKSIQIPDRKWFLVSLRIWKLSVLLSMFVIVGCVILLPL